MLRHRLNQNTRKNSFGVPNSGDLPPHWTRRHEPLQSHFCRGFLAINKETISSKTPRSAHRWLESLSFCNIALENFSPYAVAVHAAGLQKEFDAAAPVDAA